MERGKRTNDEEGIQFTFNIKENKDTYRIQIALTVLYCITQVKYKLRL